MFLCELLLALQLKRFIKNIRQLEHSQLEECEVVLT
jgi:hypothetical protein